jgi:hypothetical protein
MLLEFDGLDVFLAMILAFRGLQCSRVGL